MSAVLQYQVSRLELGRPQSRQGLDVCAFGRVFYAVKVYGSPGR